MTLIVKNQEGLRTALVEIEFFTSISGLQLNRKKSTGMWIGKSKGDEARGAAPYIPLHYQTLYAEQLPFAGNLSKPTVSEKSKGKKVLKNQPLTKQSWHWRMEMSRMVT
ncbi:hypothetical protein ElyMa_004365000 [Elysia marginata]|uniref:Uncharacterized protein n=1 Tax=Elysia marginata TaxID=1093978 RepID=A0AAV4H8F2_9GAST|nr:hypothetical protein ElyMa_004365000 [Elysia marginata]